MPIHSDSLSVSPDSRLINYLIQNRKLNKSEKEILQRHKVILQGFERPLLF